LDHLQLGPTPESSTRELLNDAHRFVEEFSEQIAIGPLQIYYSALPFTSHHTLLFKTFQSESSAEVVTMAPISPAPKTRNRLPLLLTSFGTRSTPPNHRDSAITLIAFSPDSTRIVTASVDHTMTLWNLTSGTLIATLKGHFGPVSSITFSLDGKRMVSGSYDCTIQLWNSRTGTHTAKLTGHSAAICSLAFSRDRTHVVSGSDDHSVRLWDTAARRCITTVMMRLEKIVSVTFLPEGIRALSISPGDIVRLWDPTTRKCIAAFNGRLGIDSIKFSPDGTHVMSAVGDKLMLWESTTGQQIPEFEGCTPTIVSHHCTLEDRWVLMLTRYRSTRVCLLPAKYDRGVGLVKVSNEKKIAIGYSIGSLVFIDLSGVQ
jgi:WD40 repeat protein